MANLFAANEIVKMSVDEETAGEVFYRTWSEKTGNAKIKAEAARIADMEKHHAEVFNKLLAKLGQPEAAETYQGEYQDYVDALMADKEFGGAEGAAKLASSLSDLEAVNVALKTEQKALLLYAFLEKQLDPADHATVAAVIEEERTHVVDLTKLKGEVSG
ncbi:MAG: ferritin family protein [Planctomycetota bacterium]|jgi:rubrerythrin